MRFSSTAVSAVGRAAILAARTNTLEACSPHRQDVCATMGNTFGQLFRITTFGESHGAGIGVVIDGVPPSLPLSEAEIQVELDRRRPGQSNITTQRKETDKVDILSGVFEGMTTGVPLAMSIR